MSAADAFTRASPTYIAAMRSCQKSGEAFEITGGKPVRSGWWLVAVGLAVVVVAKMAGLV